MTLKDFKEFAHWNFDRDSSVQITSDKDEEFAVSDPWMDHSGRFELRDADAIATWGLEVIVDFCIKAQKAIERMFSVKEVCPVYTGGGIWVFLGMFENGAYFITDHYITRIVREDPQRFIDDCFFESWQDDNAEEYMEKRLDEGTKKKISMEVLDFLLDNPDKRDGITEAEIENMKADLIDEETAEEAISVQDDDPDQADGMGLVVMYHNKDLEKLEYIDGKSDWVDLRAAENVHLKQGEYHLVDLGISVKLPAGYEMIIAPRSSTFKNFGVIQTNSIGLIDETYCGENDIIKMPVLAMRDTDIHVNDRICQFRIQKHQPRLNFNETEHMEDASRGGFGSTGRS